MKWGNMMSKKKYLRVLAATLSLLPVLAGCGKEEASSEEITAAVQKSSDSEKETIYVRTAARTYSAAGEVVGLKTWEYNDRGMMLSYGNDMGVPEPSWDPELGLFVVDENSKWTAIDGVLDSYERFEYDEQGSMSRVQYQFNQDQPETAYECEWTYEAGLPQSMVMRDVSNGELKAEDTQYQFIHDKAGNLTHIAYVNAAGEKHYVYKMAYDDEKRMTRMIKCEMECDRIYDFSYNEKGLVEEYHYSTSTPTGGATEDVIGIQGEANWQMISLTYTEDGQLKSFDGCQYQYEDGKLVAMDIGDTKMEFGYDGTTPQDPSGKRTYDEKGCLVKVLNNDGTYTEYEYQKLELSEEDALRHYTQQHSWLDPTATIWIRINYLDPVASVISVPTDPHMTVFPVTEYYK